MSETKPSKGKLVSDGRFYHDVLSECKALAKRVSELEKERDEFKSRLSCTYCSNYTEHEIRNESLCSLVNELVGALSHFADGNPKCEYNLMIERLTAKAQEVMKCGD
jgi:hypothetical protein